MVTPLMATRTSPSFARLLATHRIVLGSKSTSRQTILRELGLPFDCLPADIDEKAIRHSDPAELVTAIADAKADALKARLKATPGLLPPSDKTALLVTSDQVVVHKNIILEKPESAQQAASFIRGYSNSQASTVGALIVTNLASGKVCRGLDLATIFFSAIPEDTVAALVKEGGCMHAAGGLIVEHPLVTPCVERIEGTIDSVQGMGKMLILRLLMDASSLSQDMLPADLVHL